MLHNPGLTVLIQGPCFGDWSPLAEFWPDDPGLSRREKGPCSLNCGRHPHCEAGTSSFQAVPHPNGLQVSQQGVVCGAGPGSPTGGCQSEPSEELQQGSPGASRWMRQCIGPGVRRHGNPSTTATPGRACRQSPLPEKKKKSSLSEPLVNIYKVQKNTKLSFSFPIRTWVSQTAPSIYFSTPLPSFPVLALPWHCPLVGKALIQDRQLPAPLRKANADPSVLQTRSFRKQPILLLILITSCKLKAWEKKAECQRIEGLELWSCRRL